MEGTIGQSMLVLGVPLNGSLADEFLQRVTIGRHQATVAAGGEDDLADVQVAARVEPEIVWGEEISRNARVIAAAPARQ